jgi:hypothetical protein
MIIGAREASILVCLAAIAGCGPDIAPTPPEEQVKVLANALERPNDLLPLQSGNAWTYKFQTTERNKQGQARQASGSPTMKVTKVEGGVATLVYLNENKVVSEIGIKNSPTGATQTHIKGGTGATRPYSPPLPLYHWPMKVDQEIKWSGTGFRSAFSDVGKLTSTLVYKGEGEVDTPAGRMKAYRFDTTTRYTKGAGEFGTSQSLWLVPRVGIVRSIEVTVTPTVLRETEMKLQSYTVK